jgi:hypothetical protein
MGVHGIFGDESDDITVNNHGQISTMGATSHGIYFIDDSEDNVINNFKSGSIKTTGSGSHGIFFEGGDTEDNTINNYKSGLIKTTGNDADGINISGSSITNMVNNWGSIITTGDDSLGIHILGGSTDNIVNNYSSNTISTSGLRSFGIRVAGSDRNTINNFRYGSIWTTGMNARAIYVRSGSDFTVVNNYGKIWTSGSSFAHAVSFRVNAEDNTLSNFHTGTIQTKYSDTSPIYIRDATRSIINNYGRVLAASTSSTAIFDHGSSTDTTLNISPAPRSLV